MPSGDKSLHEPMLTLIYVAVWRHYNQLTYWGVNEMTDIFLRHVSVHFPATPFKFVLKDSIENKSASQQVTVTDAEHTWGRRYVWANDRGIPNLCFQKHETMQAWCTYTQQFLGYRLRQGPDAWRAQFPDHGWSNSINLLQQGLWCSNDK